MANISAPSQVSIKPIEAFVFEGIVSRLREIFGAPVVMSNSTDEIQTLAKLRQQDVRYPYLFVALTSLNITKDSYRAAPMIRRGLDTLVSVDNKQGLKVSLIPTDFVFEVKYVHNDFPAVLEFATNWLFAQATGWMKFTVSYGEEFDISFILSEDVSIPKREADPTNVQEFSLISTLTARGYMSEEKLRNQPAVTEVDVTAYLNKLAQQNGSSLFSFQRKWDVPTLPTLDETITAISSVGTTATITVAAGSLSLVGNAPTTI